MLVSVIIPMFNSEKTIARCLDSILKQSYEKLEIIVVDDGSMDVSKEIVLDYAKRNNNIRYHYQQNRGVSNARNAGIAYAEGEMLSFVDSDDMLSPDAIEKMVCNQIEHHSDLVIGNHAYIDNGTYRASKDMLEKELDVLAAVKYTMQGRIKVGCYGKLFRKKFIQKNKLLFPADRYGEDIYFLFKALSFRPIITTVPDDVYVLVNTENSICNTFDWKFIYVFDTLELIREIIQELNGWEALEEDYYKYYTHLLGFLTRYGCRFYNRKFLKEVKSGNKLSKKHIRIVKDEGWKVFADSFLFKLNWSLYCEIKMFVNKTKSR